MSAQFDTNSVYTREELQQMLGGAVSVETFLERLKVPRRFKYLVLGSDIVNALQNPPEFREEAEVPKKRERREAATAGAKRPARKANPGLEPIDMRELLTGRGR